MLLKKYLLEQLERETEASRKVIARVPEGLNTWKPHEKSMELGYLAALVASMPGWIAMMIDHARDRSLDGNGKHFFVPALSTPARNSAPCWQKVWRITPRASGTPTRNTSTKPGASPGEARFSPKALDTPPSPDGALSHMAHHRRPAHRLSPAQPGQRPRYLRPQRTTSPH